MAFSLSPGVLVREYNLTGYVPNLPSARTGVVLRANQGPCLKVVSITNENDLVNTFGYPDSTNYQDWFQAWNFLQYASSLYIVRPTNANTTNAGLAFTGSNVATPYYQGGLYNSKVAESTLGSFSAASNALYLFKKDLTADQRDAVAICSKPATFDKQIGLEFYSLVTAAGSTTVTTSENTLIAGSQVLLNNNKLATAVSVSTSSVTFDVSVADADVNPYYMEVTKAGAQFSGSVSYLEAKKSNFKAKVGSVFVDGTSASFFISGIANKDDSTYTVYLKPVTGSANTTLSLGVQSSTTTYYGGQVAEAAVAGATVIKLSNGFVLEQGTAINFASGPLGTYNVVAVDTLNGKVTLSSPITANLNAGVNLFGSNGYTTVTEKKYIYGINFFDQIYDASVILKTKTLVNPGTTAEKNVYVQSLVPFNKLFQFQPNWNNNEFCLVILTKDKLTNLYKINKTYTLSYSANAKNNYGANIFADTTLFADGNCPIYSKVSSATGIERPNTSFIPLPKFVNETASGSNVYPKKNAVTGVVTSAFVYDGYGYTKGDIQNAQDLFADPENVDINILIGHELDPNGMSTIAETRKDCVAVVAPTNYQFLSTNTSNACTSWLNDNYGTQTQADNKVFSTFGTYSAMYGNMKYQYDKFNDVNRWICVAGDMAGLYAQTDRTNDTWWAPAGSTRGVIKNCIKLAFNPNKQNRDDLYVNGINPIMAIAGEGSAIVWGQKTATSIPSAMDRVNVRRLLIFLEKSIAVAAKLGLFEFNDTFTRNRLFGIIDPFLRSVKAKRGLYDYKLVIDATNNTSQVIDANGLVIDIYLQPTKVAEFINLNMIVVPTGVSFNEVVGKFGG